MAPIVLLNCETVAALRDQLARAINTGQRPVVLVPGLEVGLRLKDIAEEVHAAFKGRWEAILQLLAEKPVSTVVSMARYTSDELLKLLRVFFDRIGVDEGQRDISQVFGDMELYHMAFVALTFPPGRAAKRVFHYAVMEKGFELAMWEHARRWHEAGGEKSTSHAAFLLIREAFPEDHPQPWQTLRQQINSRDLARLARALPPVLRGPGRTSQRSKGRDKDDNHIILEGEIITAIGDIIGKLKQRDEYEIMAMWIGADNDLSYVPRQAKMDLLNRFEKLWESLPKKDLICPFCDVPVDAKSRICPKCGVGIPKERQPRGVLMSPETEGRLLDSASKPPDFLASERVAIENIRATVFRAFHHTPIRKKILQAILDGPSLDRSQHGAVDDLAEAVGCRRETVSRYLSALKRHKPAIDKAFLG